MLKDKTVVIDLDGTLLNDEKKISDADLKAIIKLSASNNIIIASGRNNIETMRIIKQYKLHNYIVNYVICSNGQQIYDINRNIIVRSNYIKSIQAIKIINILDKYNIYWYIINNRKLYCRKVDYNCKKYIDNKRYNINILKYNENIKNVRIEKFILNTESLEKMNNIKDILCLKGNINFFKEDRLKEYNKIEYYQNNILPRGINKYTAIQFIIEKINLSRFIIAFGNGINDYEILNNANLSICMQNSDNLIKGISDFITLSNNESGVSYAINNFLDA